MVAPAPHSADAVIAQFGPAAHPRLAGDPVFGVKESLVVPFKPVDDAGEAARRDVPVPFALVRQDFRLRRAADQAE